MRIIKIKDLSIPAAILLSGLIVGLSVFLTTWIFFGGDNNRQKLFTPNPSANKQNQQQNTLTPQQIQMIQQQREAILKQQQASGTPSMPPPMPTPNPVKAPKR